VGVREGERKRERERVLMGTLYISPFVNAYIYIHTHTHTQRERERVI